MPTWDCAKFSGALLAALYVEINKVTDVVPVISLPVFLYFPLNETPYLVQQLTRSLHLACTLGHERMLSGVCVCVCVHVHDCVCIHMHLCVYVYVLCLWACGHVYVCV